MKFQALLAAALMLFGTDSDAAPSTSQWNFKVYLDDEAVGYHHYILTEEGEQRLLDSRAQFDVRFLGFKAYSYTHAAQEKWQKDCLAKLVADTDDNGDRFHVTGQADTETFALETGGRQQNLNGCIMSFAYWNPTMLKQNRLLNPQNGEYLPVSITERGTETIRYRGQPTPARRYHLKSPKFEIDLWYSSRGEWLALDSSLENGSKLKYRIE